MQAIRKFIRNLLNSKPPTDNAINLQTTITSAVVEQIPIVDLIRIIVDYAAAIVLAVGGYDESDVDIGRRIEAVTFDVRANSFRKLSESNLPSECIGHALVFDDDGRILIVGGGGNRSNWNWPRPISQLEISPTDGSLTCKPLSETIHPQLHQMNRLFGATGPLVGTNYRDGRRNCFFMFSRTNPDFIRKYTFADDSAHLITMSVELSLYPAAAVCITGNRLWIYSDVHRLAYTDISADNGYAVSMDELVRGVPTWRPWTVMPDRPNAFGLCLRNWTYLVSYEKTMLICTGPSIYAFDVVTQAWSDLVLNTGLTEWKEGCLYSGPLLLDGSISLFGYAKAGRHAARFDIATGKSMPIGASTDDGLLHRGFIAFLLL